jgi:hypothetical protein
MLDYGLTPQEEIFAHGGNVWDKIQEVGGAGIAGAELTDRGLSLVLGQQVATKRGMTIEQALYGTFDMVLKNNFLSREFNPTWMRSPKVKAMTMFQATPFKLMQKRLVNFMLSGKIVKDLGKDIYNLTKADFKAGNFENTASYIGSYGGVSSFFTGDIAEVLLYDDVLASAYIDRLIKYLSQKWAI